MALLKGKLFTFRRFLRTHTNTGSRMKKIDKRIIIMVSLLFIILMGYGLMKYLISLKAEPPARKPQTAKRFVKAEVVNYSRIVSPASESGRLYSMAEIDIIAEASGRIEPGEVPLKKGAGFSKGNVLFIVYPDEAALSLKAQKSQFLNSLANLLPDINIDYPDNFQTFQNFFTSIDLEKDLPAFPNVSNDKLRIFLASRNILSEYYTIKKNELELSRRTFIAPFDGTYTEVNLEVGSYTNTGGRVANAIRTDVLEMEVPLDRFDANWVKVGDEVIIRSDKHTHEWKGKVVRKNKFIDEDTQTQGVFIRVNNNARNALLVGEYPTAYFPGQPVERAMEIPRNAVFNSNEVFIIENGRLQKKDVNVIKVNENTLLIDGLPEGDTLVMQPLINVLEGTKVAVQGEEEVSGKTEKKMMGQNKSGQQ